MHGSLFLSSVAPRHDELFVSTGSGLLQRINWQALLEGEMTMSIHSIPFTNDLENARGIFLIHLLSFSFFNKTLFVHLVYC